MKIVPFSEDNWSGDNTGRPNNCLLVQSLLTGDPERNDNFKLSMAWARGTDYNMPRHRHNFDQIRLSIAGEMNLGDLTLKEGQIGYFPEGTPYGPQIDPPGDRLQLVLQFGGASGYGYMSLEQRRKAWAELSKTGRFEGPRYHYADGRVEWALNTVWEQVFGAKLRYPRPRFKEPVIIDPRYFNWVPQAEAAGVDHKFMGAFTERGVWVEKIRIAKGATWESADPRGRRIFSVLSGTGDVEGQVIDKFAALQADPVDTLSITASEEMELFLIGLPPIETPAVESDQYDTGDETLTTDLQAA